MPTARAARRPRPRRDPVQAILKRVFGFSELRPGQREVIDSVLAGRHTLAVMPTGAGKSLCYQVPALVKPGMTVVVSPLIALMRDQFDKLSALGLPSVQVNSAIASDELKLGRTRIGQRNVEFVFTTPEQLISAGLLALLGTHSVDLLVIDEAHCISQWGHDFRPAYLEALSALARLGHPTVLALTATAPPEIVDDLTHQLGLGPLHVVNLGAYRPNLSLRVTPVTGGDDKNRQVIERLRQQAGAVIVYAATVRHVEELATVLRNEGLEVVQYHGRMRAADRTAAQDAFMSGRVPHIVATNAFGMGIDRADIRCVIHYDLPSSLDVYSQEAGRAGRDGLPAECVLLFQRSDRALQQFFMAGRYPSHDDFTTLVQVLQARSDTAVVAADIRDAAPGLSLSKVRVMLKVLKDAGLVREARRATFAPTAGLETVSTGTLVTQYETRRQRDQARLEQMVVYAQTARCRTRVLLDALGEPPEWDACGHCDNCHGTAVRPVAVAAGGA